MNFLGILRSSCLGATIFHSDDDEVVYACDGKMVATLLEGSSTPLSTEVHRKTWPELPLRVPHAEDDGIYSGRIGCAEIHSTRSAHTGVAPAPTKITEEALKRLSALLADGLVDERPWSTSSSSTAQQSRQDAQDEIPEGCAIRPMGESPILGLSCDSQATDGRTLLRRVKSLKASASMRDTWMKAAEVFEDFFDDDDLDV